MQKVSKDQTRVPLDKNQWIEGSEWRLRVRIFQKDFPLLKLEQEKYILKESCKEYTKIWKWALQISYGDCVISINFHTVFIVLWLEHFRSTRFQLQVDFEFIFSYLYAWCVQFFGDSCVRLVCHTCFFKFFDSRSSEAKCSKL